MADNTIKQADTEARVANVEFVRAFEEDVRKLGEILAEFTPVLRNPGTALKYYETSGTLESGKVGEAELVPLSKYTQKGEKIASLDWNKWRTETSLEAVSANGYDDAVGRTDRKFVRDIQAVIRKSLGDFLKTGTGKAWDAETKKQGTAAITGATLQQTLANLWGEMQVQFENTDASPVYFLNPLDVADYLGTANIGNSGVVTFGMTYLENFLGMYPSILLSDVAKGTVVCTPRENLHIYYADAAQAEGFQYYTNDETGYVGVCHTVDHDYNVVRTHAVSAMTPFCDYLDKIYIANITPATA